MKPGPGRLCFTGPDGAGRCLDEEEASQLFEEVAQDLELLGLARRAGGDVLIDARGLVGLAPSCYVFARGAYGDGFRSEARRNPRFWAIATLISCVESELATRRLDYGIEAGRAAKFDDKYHLVLASLLHAALDKPPYADILTGMFRKVFGV